MGCNTCFATYFDPTYSPKVVQDAGVDIVANSAVNFYEGVTQKEVEAYYKMHNPNDNQPISYGFKF